MKSYAYGSLLTNKKKSTTITTIHYTSCLYTKALCGRVSVGVQLDKRGYIHSINTHTLTQIYIYEDTPSPPVLKNGSASGSFGPSSAASAEFMVFISSFWTGMNGRAGFYTRLCSAAHLERCVAAVPSVPPVFFSFFSPPLLQKAAPHAGAIVVFQAAAAAPRAPVPGRPERSRSQRRKIKRFFKHTSFCCVPARAHTDWLQCNGPRRTGKKSARMDDRSAVN